MKILQLIKEKYIEHCQRVAGVKPPNDFAKVRVFKNKKVIFEFESDQIEYGRNVCDLLMIFQKYDKYQIVCDYVSRIINVYFTTTTAKDIDAEVVDKNKK